MNDNNNNKITYETLKIKYGENISDGLADIRIYLKNYKTTGKEDIKKGLTCLDQKYKLAQQCLVRAKIDAKDYDNVYAELNKDFSRHRTLSFKFTETFMELVGNGPKTWSERVKKIGKEIKILKREFLLISLMIVSTKNKNIYQAKKMKLTEKIWHNIIALNSMSHLCTQGLGDKMDSVKKVHKNLLDKIPKAK